MIPEICDFACIFPGLTISLFREGYPEELFRSLESYGLKIRKAFDGIYYVEGILIPAQIMVTKELESGKHWSLKILSRNALEEDISGFVEKSFDRHHERCLEIL